MKCCSRKWTSSEYLSCHGIDLGGGGTLGLSGDWFVSDLLIEGDLQSCEEYNGYLRFPTVIVRMSFALQEVGSDDFKYGD